MSRRIYIFDTTLRDGEQSPGATLSVSEKIEIAHQLARLQVDVIEAGFPISSPDDFRAVQEIARQVRGPEICALSRVRPEDIERAWEAVKKAERPRIHTFIATSDIHTERKLRKSREEVLQMAVDSVKLARQLVDGYPQAMVEFSTEDAGRTEIGYLCAVVEATIEAGADVVNIPDTVGYTPPSHFAHIIREIKARVPNIGQTRLSCHCHNDLGMAVANSLAAVEEGVEQVECTINGLGERAGNASLEEIVMALYVRQDHFQCEIGIVAPELYRTSRLVSARTGIAVQLNKAIVGGNAFRHSAGIHQDGMLKDSQTYEIMRPEDVGWPTDEQRLPLTPRSGRHGLSARLEEMGHVLSEVELERAYEQFIRVADRKKEVFDEDLAALVDEVVTNVPEIWSLLLFSVITGTNRTPHAVVCLGHAGQEYQGEAHGDGAVDAACKVINRITGIGELILVDFNLSGVTEGHAAMAEAIVRVRDNGIIVIGRGLATDVNEASVRAYLNAVNKILWRRENGKSQEEG